MISARNTLAVRSPSSLDRGKLARGCRGRGGALALDGHIALIGTLSGFPEQIPLGPLFRNVAHLSALYVGSRADFEAMNRFIAEHEVRPVIDRVYDFDDARAAFDHMENADYMGKIVIRVP